jgi:hypothetical protein
MRWILHLRGYTLSLPGRAFDRNLQRAAVWCVFARLSHE